MFAFWQFDYELLDKRRHIFVGNDFAFPFFNTEHRIGNGNGKVAFQFALAAQTVVLFNLLAGEVSFLDVENFSTTFGDLALALSA